MSKGIIKFRDDADGLFNSREIFYDPTKDTLFVMGINGKVELARADAHNINQTVINDMVAPTINFLADEINILTNDVTGIIDQVNIKKDKVIGLVYPIPADLLTLQNSTTIVIQPVRLFNGVTVLPITNEQYLTVDPAYNGKTIYIGLDKNGFASYSDDQYSIPLVLGNIYVDTDGHMQTSELSKAPYLSDNSLFSRANPVSVNGFDIRVQPDNTVNTVSYNLVKEGISYLNADQPNLKTFPAVITREFKYYYSNYNYSNEPTRKVFTAAYYNTTTQSLEDVPSSSSKWVVYRVVLIETGQLLMLTQQVGSEADLFDSYDDVSTKINQLQWNLETLSSRAIYLPTYIAVPADGSEPARVVEQNNSITNNAFVTNNVTTLVYGVLDSNTNLPATIGEFVDMFQTTPVVSGSVIKFFSNNQTWSWFFIVEFTGSLITWSNLDLSAMTVSEVNSLITGLSNRVTTLESPTPIIDLGEDTNTSYTLQDNSMYGLLRNNSQNLTFVLPTIAAADRWKHHQIKLYLNCNAGTLTNITWGTTLFINGKAPDLKTGPWEIFWEWIPLQNVWTCGGIYSIFS